MHLACASLHCGKLEFCELLLFEIDQTRKIVPERWATMSCLAWCYSRQNRSREAVEVLEKVLGIQIDLLGYNHPGTIVSMLDIPEILYVLGHRKNTLHRLKDVVSRQISLLGTD